MKKDGITVLEDTIWVVMILLCVYLGDYAEAILVFGMRMLYVMLVLIHREIYSNKRRAYDRHN